MWIWHRGTAAANEAVIADRVPTSELIKQLQAGNIARVPGSAVFLTRSKEGVPPVLSWHVRKNRALHSHVLALTLTVMSTPRYDERRSRQR